jgi:hypothetical protein
MNLFDKCTLGLVAALGVSACVSTSAGAPGSSDRNDDGPDRGDATEEGEPADEAEAPDDDEGRECPSRVTLQRDVEKLAGCEEFADLTLEGQGIISLAPLADLRKVSGTLALLDTRVKDLSGLSAITEVRHLQLANNGELASLDGLASGAQMNELTVDSAPALRSIDALAGVTLKRLTLHFTRIGDVDALRDKPLESAVLTYNLELRSAEGLASFRGSQDGALELSNNPLLSALPAMPLLREVASFTMVDNPSLAGPLQLGSSSGITVFDFWLNLTPGVTSLPRVTLADGGSLGISGTRSITSLAGIETQGRLRSLGIEDNAALTSLEDLSGTVGTPDGTLVVTQNAQLTTLAGLEGWTSVGRVKLMDNPALITLAGLAGAADTTRTLTTDLLVVSNNASLATLAGLSVSPVDLTEPATVVVEANPQLPECEVEVLRETLGSAAEVRSEGNDEAAVCPAP